MNYEKLYKEAIERAKNYCNGHHTDVNPQKAMGYIFPELKESEDEKILNQIQDHLREYRVDKKGYPYVAEPDSPEMMEYNWLKSLKERMKGGNE